MKLTERRPISNKWRELLPPTTLYTRGTIALSMWMHRDGTRVISELINAEAPDGRGDVIPQWHISVARPKARATKGEVQRALLAFQMVGTEEDNHESGNARHFWQPVDPSRRVSCECKAEDQVVVDDDGHTWSNPRAGMVDPALCHSCQMTGITGRPCPLHGSAVGFRTDGTPVQKGGRL